MRAESINGGALPQGDAPLNVVLHQPEIPHNTGAIGRLCLATGARLHLIEPLGFSMDDKQLKRAGLDYWKEVDLRCWPSWDALQTHVPPTATMHLLTTKASKPYWAAPLGQRPLWLVFGPETRGLPESLLRRFEESCLNIPMQGARSLNLATAAAIVLYEAVRQHSLAGQ